MSVLSCFSLLSSRWWPGLTELQDPNDPLSYLSAWLALVPQALCVIYVTLIWASREMEIAMMFAGQMGCEAFNFALKRLIQEERPKGKQGVQSLSSKRI